MRAARFFLSNAAAKITMLQALQMLAFDLLTASKLRATSKLALPKLTSS